LNDFSYYHSLIRVECDIQTSQLVKFQIKLSRTQIKGHNRKRVIAQIDKIEMNTDSYYIKLKELCFQYFFYAQFLRY